VPPRAAESWDRGEEGSASLELVGVLPFFLLAVLVAAQLAIAGASLWSASVAARAGARASLVGGAVGPVARGALPPPLREGARIGSDDRGIEVEVPVPRLLPGMPSFGVAAKTRLGPGG
jgi:hypothetical protein